MQHGFLNELIKESENLLESLAFTLHLDHTWWLSGKESACKAGESVDADSIPGLERSSGGGNGNPLQYSCLESAMDRGAWWATVHGVTKESDMT